MVTWTCPACGGPVPIPLGLCCSCLDREAGAQGREGPPVNEWAAAGDVRQAYEDEMADREGEGG